MAGPILALAAAATSEADALVERPRLQDGLQNGRTEGIGAGGTSRRHARHSCGGDVDAR